MSLAAALHYLSEYSSGNNILAEILNLKVVSARNSDNYEIVDSNTSLTRNILPENIKFLQGCTVEGTPYDIEHLHISKKDSLLCEGCGTRVICGEDLDGSITCSNCLYANEDISARNLITTNCEECNFSQCSWNQERESYG